jgi:hypothetical protein
MSARAIVCCLGCERGVQRSGIQHDRCHGVKENECHAELPTVVQDEEEQVDGQTDHARVNGRFIAATVVMAGSYRVTTHSTITLFFL